jgi:hypothetical protein
MACPSCKSDEWRLCSLVHNEGLSSIKTQTTGSGVGASGSGGLTFGVGSARTSGSQQTALSKEAAPPQGFIVTAILALAALVLVGGGYFFGDENSYPPRMFYTAAVLCAGGIFFFFPREKKKYGSAKAAWKVSRMCQRCGTRYMPMEVNI